jgi:hypothetical protein
LITAEDIPDILNDIHVSMAKWARNNPEQAARIVDPKRSDMEDALSGVLAFLKKTVKNRVLELCEKQAKGLRLFGNEVGGGGSSEGRSAEPPGDSNPGFDELLDILKECIKDDADRIVCQEIFQWGAKAQDVADRYPNLFRDVEDVYNAIRRFRRCARRVRDRDDSSGAGPESLGPTSLEYRMGNQERQKGGKVSNTSTCPFDEGILLDYVNGHLDVELRTAIEQSPACLKAVTELREELSLLQPMLRSILCPDTQVLVAFQAGDLDEATSRDIERHVQVCKFCRQEMRMLTAFDEYVAGLQPGAPEQPRDVPQPKGEHPLGKVVRTLREAFRVPPALLPSPVVGEMLVFQTPQIVIDLDANRSEVDELTWTLAGAVRTSEGELVSEIDEVSLEALTGSVATVTVAQPPGIFVFKGLEAGKYRLRVLTPTEEILIREIELGYGE